jgi:RimJ/RimL family protein N-acetyltransferase
VSEGTVRLLPWSRRWIERMAAWRNDPAVALPSRGRCLPVTMEDQEGLYEQVCSDPTIEGFMIAVTGGDVVGYATLNQIDSINGTAWVGLVIGETSCWGRGYGTRALRLVMDKAFDDLGLRNVTAAIHDDNRASLRIFEKVGFKAIGRQRRGVRRPDGIRDIILLDCLKDDLREEAACP